MLMSSNANNGFDEWGGYMHSKIAKLEEQYALQGNSYKQSNLFDGISIFVNGFTQPSGDELKRLMMIHGGIYHHYERDYTTFIVASNLPDVKVSQMNMSTAKIISSDWIIDCVKEQRILDYKRYLLYTNRKRTQPCLSFVRKETDSTKEFSTKNVRKVSSPEVSSSKVEFTPSNANNDTKISEREYTSLSSARTAVDPDFLMEFYNNSRLHHIATLGAGFKQYISELRERNTVRQFPARQRLKEKLLEEKINTIYAEEAFDKQFTNCIMHIDMDCFFVSVGLRKCPQFKGLPIAVTHSKGGLLASEVPIHPNANRQIEMELFCKRYEERLHDNILSDKMRGGMDSKMSLAEIACASYEARAKGIKNGMFVGHALKLCPELITIPYDFRGYREVGFMLYDIIAQYTYDIEAVSCDEMFVDLTNVLNELQITPMTFVKLLRDEVRMKTGCTCSAGIGSNKLQARMATKKAKPDGQSDLTKTNIEAYMVNVPIDELPGVGSSIAFTLRKAGQLNCGDLQKTSLAHLQLLVGKKMGKTLYEFCRGIDTRNLKFDQKRKSVSAEVNYGIRFKTNNEMEAFFRQLCTEVYKRLLQIKRKAKRVTIKLMIRAKNAPIEASKFLGHGICDQITKSILLPRFSNDYDEITSSVFSLIKKLTFSPKELRGIGIHLSKLDERHELNEKINNNDIKNMFSKVKQKQKKKLNTSPINFQKTTEVDTDSMQTIDNDKTQSNKLLTLKKNIQTKCTKSTSNVFNIFQTFTTKEQQQQRTNELPPDINPEIFNELPDGIQEEIIHDNHKIRVESHLNTRGGNNLLSSFKIGNKVQQFSKIEEITPELKNLFRQIKLELDNCQQVKYSNKPKNDNLGSQQRNIKPCNNSANISNSIQYINNIFMQTNWKEILLNWIQGTDIPEVYDINFMSACGRQLVLNQQLDRLFDVLSYVCFLVNKQKSTDIHCAWHCAICKIVQFINDGVQQIYDGRRLYLPFTNKFICHNSIHTLK